MSTFFAKSKRQTIIVVLGVLMLGQLAPALAASASPAGDTLTRQKAGQTSNHQISFKTPTGIDSSSDTITVAMPDFVFGSVGIGDVDLFYGATGLENTTTLAASASAGVWGAGITGTTITFTAPTNAAPGSIPTNSIVVVRIGTNAVGGTNQLTNPASPVTSLVTIGGTFGDSIVMKVIIIAEDSVSVTAVVPAVSHGSAPGGGVPPPPPPPAPSAPVISNIQIGSLSQTGATITWSTDLSSNSSVSYGNDVSYASGTVSAGTQVTSHSIVLSGLVPHSLYHFKVASTDGSTTLSSESGDVTFSTTGDTTPPLISNVLVTGITDRAAAISWTTNEPATSKVSYGTTTSYGADVSVPGMATDRSIDLTGLAPGTVYHYIVTSVDAEGNTVVSSDATFTTVADNTPPPNITVLTATPGDGQVTLDWTNPNVPDLVGIRIVRKTTGFPTGPNDGTRIFDDASIGYRYDQHSFLAYRAFISVATSYVDTGLTNGTTYYYGVYAYDASGNVSSGALISAAPNGPIPPLPEPPTTTPPVPPPPEAPPEVPPGTPPPEVPPLPPSSAPAAPPVFLPPGAAAVPGAPSSGTGGGAAIVHGEMHARFSSLLGIWLVVDPAGQIGVIQGSTVQVNVALSEIGASAKAAFVAIQGSLFSLQLNAEGTEYTGSFVVPSAERSDVTVSVQLQDDSYLASKYTFVSQPGISVREQTMSGSGGAGIPGASVSIYRKVDGSATRYGEPLTAGADGSVAVYVQNGTYYVEAKTADSLKSISDTFEVRLNVPNATLKLLTPPKPVVLPPNASTAERAVAAVQQTANEVVYVAQVARAIIDTPAVQQANAVAAPIALTISIVNTASSLSMFSTLAFLQNIFTQPLLLLGRKRRRRWGIVYNSLGKQPIELAIVRLVHAETRLVIQSKVTDKQGRYWFPAHKGNYLIEVVKPGYLYPSQYLVDAKEDVELVDLYHGESIELLEDNIIARNIPLDPAFSEETPKQILFKSAMQTLKYSISFGSIILGMVVLFISPSASSGALLVSQIAAFFLFRRLGMPVKAKNWGYTFDPKTQKPISNVIVRIFDKKFNKLLETQVTDKNGKFGFFVKENVYYMTADKAGYAHYVSGDVDLRGKKDTAISQNIPMEPTSAGAPSKPSPPPAAPPSASAAPVVATTPSPIPPVAATSVPASASSPQITAAPSAMPPSLPEAGSASSGMIPADPPPKV